MLPGCKCNTSTNHRMMKEFEWLVLLLLVTSVRTFVLQPQSIQRVRHCRALEGNSGGNVKPSSNDEEKIRSMRVKEIQAELRELNVNYQGVFEKEELVKRLAEARGKEQPKGTTYDAARIATTLYFTQPDNRRVESAGITIEPDDQPFATIRLSVGQNELSVLLDTACSGIVLRPEVRRRCGLRLSPTPATMTGASGTVSRPDVTELPFKLVGSYPKSFGPFPVALQEIDALPSALDGIVGLSFLSQFLSVDFDFCEGMLRFHESTDQQRSDVPETARLLTRAPMKLLSSLRVFTAPVFLDGRGPVTMLVDTGAASTILNWDGVASLGLSRSELEATPSPMGALGTDSTSVMELTHRLVVRETLSFGNNDKGMQLARSNPLAVDVGAIPILDSIPGVGGILGVDALVRSRLMRIACREPFEISLYD